MQKRHVLSAAMAAAVALAAVPVALAASSAQPAKVTVRIEAKSKTLLTSTAVRTQAGSITRGGAPAGSCPSTSAQGALQNATHGKWAGSWYKKYDEYYITGILGHTPEKSYWAIYVNGRYATAGACEIALKSGDAVLFAVIPDKGKTPQALGVRVPAAGTDGQQVKPVVFYDDPKGVKHVLAGASVTLGNVTTTSRAGGIAEPITLTGSGEQTLKVSKAGYIRTEATISVS
jgi:hypothetical protein